jgi:hypothetical protein
MKLRPLFLISPRETGLASALQRQGRIADVYFSRSKRPSIPIAETTALVTDSLTRLKSTAHQDEQFRIFNDTWQQLMATLDNWYKTNRDRLTPTERLMIDADMRHELFEPAVGFIHKQIWAYQQTNSVNPEFPSRCEKFFNTILDGYKRFQFFMEQGLGNHKHFASKLFGMAVSSVQNDLKNKNISLTIENQHHLKATKSLLFDFSVYTIFTNILQNAVKYTPDGGKIKVSFTIEPQETYSTLNFTVEDTGIGINPAEAQIVLRGKRGLNAIQSSISGTGYGLKRVYKILSMANSTLNIESPLRPNVQHPGTRITCKIPTRK